jgi:TetR/AcrR family transcriptional regulator, mexJK operon transcriptional repressor
MLMATTAAEALRGGKAPQILAAARQVFTERGYGAASMDAIARAAGVSKATLYAYFTGKEALFAAIIGGECGRFGPTLCGDGDGDGDEPRDVRADLLRIGGTFAELLLSPSTLAIYRVVIAEAPRFPELGRIFYESGPNAALTRLANYLQGATERGLIAVPEPRLAAEQLVGMIRGASHLRQLLNVRSKADPDPTRLVEGAVDVFLRAYAPNRAKAQGSAAQGVGRAGDAPKAGAETPALGNIGP